MDDTTKTDIRDAASAAVKVLFEELTDPSDPIMSKARIMAGLSVMNAAVITTLFPNVPGMTDDVIVKLAEQTRRGVASMQGRAIEERDEEADVGASARVLMSIIESGKTASLPLIQELTLKLIEPLKEGEEERGREGRVEGAAEVMRTLIALVPAVIIVTASDEGREVLWGALKMAVDATFSAAPKREDLLQQGMDRKAARH